MPRRAVSVDGSILLGDRRPPVPYYEHNNKLLAVKSQEHF